MKLTSPIILFVLASAGIHAGLVMLSNSNTITLPGSAGSVMVVQIKKQHSANKIKPEQIKNIRKESPKRRQIAAKQKAASVVDKSKQAEQKTASLQQNPAISKARVASIIYQELSPHFTYPKIAIKRNWQGKVLLSLRVTSNGRIKNVQLNNSSGYDILDQAAIHSLSKVESLPGISSWLPFDIDLNFPVIYKLIEG